MQSIYYWTNLDLHRTDEYAINDLPKDFLPVIGTRLYLDTPSKLGLEVVSVSYQQKYKVGEYGKKYAVGHWSVELHLPKSLWGQKPLTDFYKWYAPKFGQTSSAYI